MARGIKHNSTLAALIVFVVLLVCINLGRRVCCNRTGTELYETLRYGLLERELHTQLGGRLVLSPQERKANEFIMREKVKEYDEGVRNPSLFLPAQHFFNVSEQIKSSPVFALLKSMPKGGVLHAHDMALCSTDFLLELTRRENLWICVSEDKYLAFRFSLAMPDLDEFGCMWMLLHEHRLAEGAKVVDEKLRAQLTLYPRVHFTDVNEVWAVFRSIFRLVHGLLTYAPVWEEYQFQALKECYADGANYLEMRSMLPTLYDLSGRIYNISDTVRAIKEASDKLKVYHKNWLGTMVIYAVPRNVTDRQFDMYLQNAVQLKEEYDDFIAGFDLVGQEDLGRPLKNFAHKLLAVKDKINFYFHAGETNWYGTEIDENLYDALLLGSKRIGHGYALTKHPAVLQLLRHDDVAIEVCPISNQVLQHVNDFRNHPLAHFFANGYPVVISSDDPSFWKSTPLTYDYYISFLGIASRKADLRMLKQLARNSLYYSGMGRVRADWAIQVWETEWDEWINAIVNASS